MCFQVSLSFTFFSFFFFASPQSSETESLTKLDRLVCLLSFLCTSECVSESRATQSGLALVLLLWRVLLLLSVWSLHGCRAVRGAAGNGAGGRCVRTWCWPLQASLALSSSPRSSLCPLQWTRRAARGGGTAEKSCHLKSLWRAYSIPLHFTPLVPLPKLFTAFLYP